MGWLAEKNQPGRSSQSSQSTEAISIEVAFPDAASDRSGCLRIDRLIPLTAPSLSGDAAGQALIRELRLVYGVGGRYAQRLKDQGYTSIVDLVDHPRWGAASSALLTDWGSPFDPAAIHRSLARWLPSGDPLHMQSLGLMPIEALRFFDLETLGLGGAPIFLSAIGRFVEGGFLVRQFLAPSLGAEVALLERTAADLADASALLSYNGKSFDWTMLKERFAYYGLPLPDAPIHVDLLHHVRRAFASTVPDCHLGTIEACVLDIERTNDVPSAEVPLRYTEYLETGDAAPLVPVVNHNRQDLVSLVVLLDRLLQMDSDD